MHPEKKKNKEEEGKKKQNDEVKLVIGEGNGSDAF